MAKAIQLVIFTSPENCPACAKMEGIYTSLAEDYDTIFVDPTTDWGAETANAFMVQSMPMIVVTNSDREQIERFIGIKREKEIRERLKEI